MSFETFKVILIVIAAGGFACVLIGIGSVLGRFLRANAVVVVEPTPEQADHVATDPPVIERSPFLEHVRIPPYLGIVDPDNTKPLEMWERPRPGTEYQGGDYVKPGTS